MTWKAGAQEAPEEARRGLPLGLRRAGVLAAVVASSVLCAAPAQAAFGDLDPGFGNGGLAVPAAGGDVSVTSLLVQPDGKPVVGGWAASGSGGPEMVLARFTPAGALDPSFNPAGAQPGILRQRRDYGAFVWALARQPDGRLVAAGSTWRNQSEQILLARFTADGALDPSFGDDGYIVRPLPTRASYATGVAVLPGGGLVVGGAARFDSEETDFVLARFDADGKRLERATRVSFGAYSAWPQANAFALTVDDQGRPVLAGALDGDRAVLARFTAEGALDATFNPAGSPAGTAVVGRSGQGLTDVEARLDGSLLASGVGGITRTPRTSSGGGGLIARLTPAGALDPAFNPNGDPAGIALVPGAARTEFSGITLDPVGAPLAVGTTATAAGSDLLLGLYGATGAPDPLLNPAGPYPGLKATAVPGYPVAAGRAIALTPDSRQVYVAGDAGASATGERRIVVARYQGWTGPVAVLDGPDVAQVGLAVTFDASASTDPTGRIVRYEWDLDGNGSFEVDSGAIPRVSVTFQAAGTVAVGVRVTDDRGRQSTAGRSVLVRRDRAETSPVTPRQGEPPPVLGEAAVSGAVSGTVVARLPGRPGTVTLREAQPLPNGTEIDARRGRVEIVVARDASGAVDRATFFSGRFLIEQGEGPRPVTTLTLRGGSFRGCGPARARAGASAPSKRGRKARRGRSVRRLWGDGQGRFRTRGRYSAATVRGTRWLTDDRCRGTLIQVRRGRVTVTPTAGGGRALTVRPGGEAFTQAP